MAAAGEDKAAYAWLDRVLAAESRWKPEEEENLRTCYAELLRQQGRYDDVVEYLGAYVKRNPPGRDVYAQYLSALVWDDRQQQADTLIAQWLKDSRRPDELPPDVDARLQAAVAQALGGGYNLNTDRLDEQWLRPLADTAIYFARHPSASSVAEQIMADPFESEGSAQFGRSDQGRRVRKEAARMLLSDMDTLTAEQATRLINWISADDPAVEKESWKRIAAALRRRWDAEPDWEVKARFGQVLADVLQKHADAQQWLDFLRTQLAGAPEEYRAGFSASLSMPCWNSLGSRPMRTRRWACWSDSATPTSRRRDWPPRSPPSAR